MKSVTWKKGVVAAVLGSAATLAFAAPALAASYTQTNVNYNGSFTTASLYSSSLGGHSVKATLTCGTLAGPAAEVVQDFWFEPNHYLGRKTLTCGTTKTQNWSSDDSGDHFVNFYSTKAVTINSYTWTYPY